MHHAVEISLPRARTDLTRLGAWSAAIRHAPRVLGGAVATNRRAQLIKETFWRGVTLTPADYRVMPTQHGGETDKGHHKAVTQGTCT